MSIQTLLNRPCQIVRRTASTTEDAYGNLIPDETITSAVCELQPRAQSQSSEPGMLGEVSDTHWVIFLLPGETLRTGDSVIVDDETYEIVGDPWRARNPRTQQFEHIEAPARRTAGADDEVGS